MSRERNRPLTVSAIRHVTRVGCIGFSVVAEVLRRTDREIPDRILAKLRRTGLTADGDSDGRRITIRLTIAASTPKPFNIAALGRAADPRIGIS